MSSFDTWGGRQAGGGVAFKTHKQFVDNWGLEWGGQAGGGWGGDSIRALGKNGKATPWATPPELDNKGLKKMRN